MQSGSGTTPVASIRRFLVIYILLMGVALLLILDNLGFDITALVALYRPGPMDLIPDFIKRRHGEVAIEVEACGVCRTDLQLCEGDLAAQTVAIAEGSYFEGKIQMSGSKGNHPKKVTFQEKRKP